MSNSPHAVNGSLKVRPENRPSDLMGGRSLVILKSGFGVIVQAKTRLRSTREKT